MSHDDRSEGHEPTLRHLNTARGRGGALHIGLAAISLTAVAVPALLVGGARRVGDLRADVTGPKRVVPDAELPPVEPARFVPIAPETARGVNAAIAFSAGPNPAARPFEFVGDTGDLARATDCLAAAVIFEAGDDAVGERAVAQVVLNRLRHPAFPKTVCGVVFQGQERSTGCQFTFTCDGALTRDLSAGAWGRARAIAAMALKGAVHRPVGHATHYHTDWVVPYWSSSLDKIAAVGTHLFFRWTGWWGTPPAFNRRQQVGEPAIGKLAFLSEAHRAASSVAGLESAPLGAAFTSSGPAAVELAAQPDSFVMSIPAGTPPNRWPLLAQQACGDRAYCKLWAWVDPGSAPSGLPFTTAQIQALSFSYLRDRAANYEKALWNCGQARRLDARECMKRQAALPMVVARSRPDAGSTPSNESLEMNAARSRGPDPVGTAPPAELPNSRGTGTTSFDQPGRSGGVGDTATTPSG